MEFLIIGVSHHQAPVATREKFASLDLGGLGKTFTHDGSHKEGAIRESLLLSTCNRLEILAASTRLDEARREILRSLAAVSGLALEEIQPYIHEYRNIEAAGHLFRVAAGLDSLVLGEPQILGQVKEAFRQSLKEGRAGTLINKLMHKCFRTAKRARSETRLAGGAVSVAGAAVSLARVLCGGSLKGRSALVLGAGPMATLAAAHLCRRGQVRLTVMNRGFEKARILAAKNEGRARPWEELPQAAREADLVIAATGAAAPVLNLENLGPALAGREDRPLCVIDIGVPRNAAHDLKKLNTIILRNIDDLNEVVWESRAARRQAAEKAEMIVAEELEKFGQWLEGLSSWPTLSALTRKAERIRRLELGRTLNRHDFDEEQKAALEAMTGALVRRLLHDPLAYIKESAGEAPAKSQNLSGAPGGDRLAAIRRAFKIDLPA